MPLSKESRIMKCTKGIFRPWWTDKILKIRGNHFAGGSMDFYLEQASNRRRFNFGCLIHGFNLFYSVNSASRCASIQVRTGSNRFRGET